MKITLKRIAAAILTFAIALTGTLIDATTAEAEIVTYEKDRTGLENFADLKDTTITMKIGDTKNIDFMENFEECGQTPDVTNRYAWSSSDENVVSMTRLWETIPMEEALRIHSFNIKVENPGTAVIKGINSKTDETVSFTVVVKKPKMTAKMKKCKHSWKTTKKATCTRSGMKTCKKCKMRQTVARKSHAFETVTEKKYDYKYEIIYQCGACLCEDPSVHNYDNDYCENWCEAEFSSEEYGSAEAALAACREHISHCGPNTPTTKFREVPIKKIVTYKDVDVCTSCGYSKEGLDLMFKVNDPTKMILISDL